MKAYNQPNLEYDLCWSCSEPLDELHNDFTLDGLHVQVCDLCWEELSVFQRILLQLLARPQRFGGLGISEALAAISEVLTVPDESAAEDQEDEEEPDSDD